MESDMTKPRTGIPGITGLSRVVNTSAWGESKALERTKDYGGLKQTNTRPPDQSEPQFKQDSRGSDWRDDVSEKSWLRGGSKGGTDKPNFDAMGPKRYHGKR
jgi:hypothetical protein